MKEKDILEKRIQYLEENCKEIINIQKEHIGIFEKILKGLNITHNNLGSIDSRHTKNTSEILKYIKTLSKFTYINLYILMLMINIPIIKQLNIFLSNSINWWNELHLTIKLFILGIPAAIITGVIAMVIGHILIEKYIRKNN